MMANGQAQGLTLMLHTTMTKANTKPRISMRVEASWAPSETGHSSQAFKLNSKSVIEQQWRLQP
jgi:hypothetical protein